MALKPETHIHSVALHRPHLEILDEIGLELTALGKTKFEAGKSAIIRDAVTYYYYSKAWRENGRRNSR